MVRSNVSTRSIINHYNHLGKSDPNPPPDMERDGEDSLAEYSIRGARSANDSGAESIILRSDEDEDEDEDDVDYGEGYSDEDDEDQLCSDKGEDGVSGVFDGDADDRPSEYSQGPYNGGGDFIQDPPPVEQNADGDNRAELVDDLLQRGGFFASRFVTGFTSTSRRRPLGRSSIKIRCPESRQFGNCLLLITVHPHH